MTQVRLGIVLSYMSIVLTTGISLAFTPYMLGKLGPAEFGLYVLVGSLAGYLGLLTFGMGNTLVRYIARYRAVADKEREENLLAMALVVYSVMSFLVIVAGTILWFFLPDIFPKLTPYELDRAKLMFAILVGSTAIVLPSAVLSSVQTAYEYFVFPRVVMIVSSLLRTAILFILLYLDYKALAIVIVDTLLNFLTIFANLIYVFGIMKTRIHLYRFEVPLLKEIFIFSFWIFLNMVMDQLYWKFGQTVLGMTSGTTTVAIFAIGLQLTLYFMTLSTAISGVFLPRAAAMDAINASNEAMTSMMIRVGRFQLLVMGLPFVGFVSLGQLFLINWLGVDYLSAWHIAILMIVPLLLPLVQNFGIAILQAKNRHAARSIIYIIIALINVVIGYYLSLHYGSIGMAIATALSLLLGQGIAINLYYHFKIGLNMPRFFKELLHGLLPALVLCGILSYSVSLLPCDGWSGFAYKGALVALSYCFSMWLIGINSTEKHDLLSILRPFVSRLGFL
jgi:O-antigen/teichoic acid export membrane protein